MELPAVGGWLVSCCFHVVQRRWSISVRTVCQPAHVPVLLFCCTRQSASIWSVELIHIEIDVQNVAESPSAFTCYNAVGLHLFAQSVNQRILDLSDLFEHKRKGVCFAWVCMW